MLRWFALFVLVAAPGAEACAGNGAATAALELDFPKPEGCNRLAPEACPALPEADVPYVIDGVLTWSWELDAACGTTIPSASAVHIHLEGLERVNGGWFQVSAQPSEITIEPQDQWDVTDDSIDLANARFRSQESYPVQVTISLVGEPSAEALDRLASRNGLVQLDLRASAGATDTFLAVFDIEGFSLDGTSVLAPEGESGRDAPMPSAVLVLAAIAVAATLRRRA
ncbi:MAG: hypothetical protein AABY18_06205 [Candidatus Thermoplasmatota archaeon]